MTVPPITATPAATRPAHPHRYIDPAELVHDQPLGPTPAAHVNPAALPALAHAAADLDGITAPIRVVPAAELGVCVECSSGPNGDLPVLDAIAVVRALDAYGQLGEDEVCGVHLHLVVAARQRREQDVTVEAPAQHGRYWFERGPRETYFGLTHSSGVAVVRDRHDVWVVVLVAAGVVSAPLCLVPIGRDGWEGARRRAEEIAQAVAAQRATDAALLADTLAQVA